MSLDNRRNASSVPSLEIVPMANWITADLDSIVEGTKKCLERLQMDYVDVIFAHRPDHSGQFVLHYV